MDRLVRFGMDDKTSTLKGIAFGNPDPKGRDSADDIALLLASIIGFIGILGHNYLTRGYVLIPGF